MSRYNPAITNGTASTFSTKQRVLVATRGAHAAQGSGRSDGSVINGTSRIRHVATSACSQLQLTYTNVRGSGEVAGDNPIKIKASIEYSVIPGTSTTAFYPVKFGGQSEYTIQPSGTIISDPVGVFLPEGAIFYTRTYVEVSAGQYFPVCIYTNDNNEGFYPTDLTLSTAAWSQNHMFAYSPLAITGLTNSPKPAWALIGDSIVFGSGDSSQKGNEGGFMTRAINNQFPYTKMAMSGETARVFFGTGRSARSRGLEGVTHAVINYGTNDIVSSNLESIKSYLLDSYRFLDSFGIKVYACTLLPRTEGTFTNDAGQTIPSIYASGSSLDLINQWLLTLPAPLTGLFDINAIARSSTDPFKWKGGWTGDGTHPNATGSAGIAAGIASQVAAITL